MKQILLKSVRSRGQLLATAALLAVLITLLMALGAQSAPPQPLADPNCIDDLTGVTNNCTANDVNLGLLRKVLGIVSQRGQAVSKREKCKARHGALHEAHEEVASLKEGREVLKKSS